MPVITEDLANLAGIADNSTPVTFFTSRARGKSTGTGLITPTTQVPCYPVAGVITSPNLDPGPAKVRIGTETFDIYISNVAGPIRLKSLLDAAVSYPPEVVGAAQQFALQALAYRDAAQAAAASVPANVSAELTNRYTKGESDSRYAPAADLAEYIQDTVAALIKGGANVTTTYDDAANTFTINATASGGGTTDPEVVRDTIGGALVAGSGVTINVDDPGDTITIAVAGVPQSAVTGLVTALGARYTKTESDALYAVKRENAGHSLAGAAANMALPTMSDSGHAITWTQNPAGAAQFGSTRERGAFYTNPASAPSATYMALSLTNKPRWGRMRFAFLPGSTAGGTACIGVPSQASLSGTLTMAVHFRTTRAGWAFSVWENGEQVLAQGTYETALVADGVRPPEYELAWMVSGSKALFRTPDGVIRTITDARIASLGGKFLFAESYDPASTDDVVAVFSLDGGDTPPESLFASASPIARTVRSVNGVAPDNNGNVAISTSGGGNDPRFTTPQAFTIGDGSTLGPYNITHNGNSRASFVSVRQKKAPFKEIRLVDVAHPSLSALQIITDKALPVCEVDVVLVIGTTDATMPSTATVSLVSKTDTQVVLSASATDNVAVDYFNWFRDGLFIGTSPAGQNYTDTGRAPSTQYSYTATAVDTSGNESATQSTAVQVTTNVSTTPPGFDTSAFVSGNGNQSVNYAVPSGANRPVYALVSHINSAATGSSASVTIGGVAATLVDYKGSNGQSWVGVYKRDNVPGGASVAVALTTGENYSSLLAFSYAPVASTTVLASVGGGGTTASSPSTAIAGNERLISCYSTRESPTVAAGTLRASGNHSSGFQFIRVLEGAGASPQQNTITMSASAAYAVVSFKIAA